MDDTVIRFPGAWGGQVGDGFAFDPDQVLDGARGNFLQVVVCGFNLEGEIEVRASHGSRDALWVIAKAQHHVLFETE